LVIGGNVSENFTVTPNGTRVRFDRTSPAPFFLDIGTSENLVLNAQGGDDTITASNGLAPLISITVDGGAGNDTITGADGADILRGGAGDDLLQGGAGSDQLFGGDGNDTLVGNTGNDQMFGEAGDDLLVWNNGDNSDLMEGGDGHDTVQVNGAAAGDVFTISPNGDRVRFDRLNLVPFTLDIAGTETLDVNPLGGADTITVHDLSGTAVTEVNLDLASPPGSGIGDGQTDTVIVEGTGGADTVEVRGSGTSFTVAGLSALVTATGSEGAHDQLVVKGLGGDDFLSAATLPATVVNNLTLDGGVGNDTILGSRGTDFLFGGDGNDFIDGNQGADPAPPAPAAA